MLTCNGIAALSRSITTKQVRVWSQLCGAMCDHQYLLTAKPTTVRMISDDEWSKIDKDLMKALESLEGLKEDEPVWRDPIAARIQLATASGVYHNLSML